MKQGMHAVTDLAHIGYEVPHELDVVRTTGLQCHGNSMSINIHC